MRALRLAAGYPRPPRGQAFHDVDVAVEYWIRSEHEPVMLNPHGALRGLHRVRNVRVSHGSDGSVFVAVTGHMLTLDGRAAKHQRSVILKDGTELPDWLLDVIEDGIARLVDR